MANKDSYIFGPVPSRRLGFSLGIDLVPFKTCTFDCSYCQIGKTTHQSLERKSFIPFDIVIKELKQKLNQKQQIDYLTFSGSGEPTLSLDIGKIIKEIKTITKIPVAVLTNASLLYREDVKNDLTLADLLVPSMDAVTEEVFTKINYPSSELKLNDMLHGLCDIKKWFNGELRLEIMFIKGINDSAKHIELLTQWVKKIAPDKIELNTVVRPPKDAMAHPLDQKRLEGIAQQFGEKAIVITGFSKDSSKSLVKENKSKVICDALKRRPLTVNDLIEIVQINSSELNDLLVDLEKKGCVQLKKHNQEIYYFLEQKD